MEAELHAVTPSAIVWRAMSVERAEKAERVLGMLFLTRRCNLACRYCHMDRGDEDADREILKAGIDLLFRSFDRVELQFFGGEPLLRMDLLKWCVDYVKEAWSERPPTHFLVTTNALLLRGPVVDALLERGVHLMISLDGASAARRAGRLGDDERAYRVITDNMRELGRRGVPFFVNAVVSPDNVDAMGDNVAALFDLGATTVQVAYELGATWDREHRQRYVEALLRTKERYRHEPRRRVQNNWESEPVLGSSFFVLDVHGALYHGCAIVLEESMPAFDRATRIGSVSSVSSLAPLRRSLLQQLGHIRGGTRSSRDEYARLRSNLLLGLAVRRQLRRADEWDEREVHRGGGATAAGVTP
jgi:sulfatase maturation enzyme AslB (radical SAM superfamily)